MGEETILLNGLLVLLTAFMVSVLLVPPVMYLAKRYNLGDEPGGRKIHVRKTPSLGGVAIVTGFLTALVFLHSEFLQDGGGYKFAAVLVMFLLGLRDDLKPVSAYVKIVGVITAALFALYKGDYLISSFYEFGEYTFPLWLSYLVSVLFILLLTNAYNLADGLDGLATWIAIIPAVVLGVCFFMRGDIFGFTSCLALTGALLGFLKFNSAPARIFMGDGGSLAVGIILCILFLLFINGDCVEGEDCCTLNNRVIIMIALFSYPIFDTIRLVVTRFMRRQSPLRADKTHGHHLLLRIGLTHSQAVFVIALFTLGGIFLVLLLDNLGNHWLVLALLILYVVLSYAILFYKVRHFCRRKN